MIRLQTIPPRTSRWQAAALLVLLILFLADFWAAGLPEGALFYQWDKLVHLIAGALLAALFYPYLARPRDLILFVVALGGLFEIAEFMTTPMADYGGVRWYLADTAADLLVDALGAWIMITVIKKHHGR